MASAQAFTDMVNGHGYDIDGYYGAQCWDGFAEFTKFYYGKVFNCSQTGYAIDLWTLRNSNGSNAFFDFITDPNALQQGDWIIFNRAGATPYSHVGMFERYDGSNFVLLAQNQGGTAYPGGGSNFNQISISRNSFAGALRPKIYEQAAPAGHLARGVLTAAKGTAKVTVPGVNVRSAPNVGGGSVIVGSYSNGQTFNYDNYIITGGYVWLSYVAASGNRRYIAEGPDDGNPNTVYVSGGV